MILTRREKRFARVVSPVVGLAVVLGGYAAHGPFTTAPVVVHTPLVALSGAVGVYLRGLPDFIFVDPQASDTVVRHETMHYAHPWWSECRVSAALADQGVHDYYYKTEACK